MSVLSSGQRKLLSDVVVQAREVVESACAQRVEALGIGMDKAPASLLDGDRDLRVGLRARARQLGSVDALVTEAGFEHWHRMLFVRFLADNGLLVDDVAGQPVSIDEVGEYAAEMGEFDMWEVAARFASVMLPGMFRLDDPVLQMRLPVETRQDLERLLNLLPPEVITADDALGWVYQYWQARRKDEVNKSGRKIGGADLAPVTQLFTEDYMVRFLLENSLGAWWAVRHPESVLIGEWEFLRRGEDGSPAAGAFDGWPGSAAELSVMDPCCGSGHFLVSAFAMLWRMRVEEEGLTAVAAQNAVLRDNLFGLELDPRCTQIAMFALVLEAWKTEGYRPLPLPNVACSGIPAKAPLEEWTRLADGDPLVEASLGRLHALFANADTLGSLIDPIRATEQAGLQSMDWHSIAPLVQQALTAENKTSRNAAADVFGDAAAGIARAADFLSRRYSLIVTNVPYLSRGGQADLLATHCAAHFSDGRADLAAAFVIRCAQLAHEGATCALVTPQNWLTLTSYTNLRRGLLRSLTWSCVVRLGAGAFRTISGEVVQPALLILSSAHPEASQQILALNLSQTKGAAGKAAGLKSAAALTLQQRDQLANPDARIVLGVYSGVDLLSKVADGVHGLGTKDSRRFIRNFWEVQSWHPDWEFMQSSVSRNTPWGGMEHIVYWQQGKGILHALAKDGWAILAGGSAHGRPGVLVSQVGSLACTLYAGGLFEKSAAVVALNTKALLPAVWSMCTSPDFARAVRAIDQKVAVTNRTLVKVPFDVERWREVAKASGPLPAPSSDDPTQWLFRGDPAGSTQPLQVAVARLMGFEWPDQEPDALDVLADAGGIVCLPAVGGESPGAERLRGLLAAAYGDSWSPTVLDGLLANLGAKPGAAGLEEWLRGGFFKDHCKVFANRPFIWQIWDGTPNGFSALVNYHRLDRKLLERLTYDYLGNWWMGRERDEVKNDIPGGEARLMAAEDLKRKLVLILEGEQPYDIFARWKSLADQPLGWEPDLDDGVRINIRPFVAAGILRAKPNIKWDKDRGKNPDGTERHNDAHRTLAAKRQARGGGAG